MFVSSSLSSGLEFWSFNHISIYKNFELKVFKDIKFLGEISNKWPNDVDLVGKNVCKTLKF